MLDKKLQQRLIEKQYRAHLALDKLYAKEDKPKAKENRSDRSLREMYKCDYVKVSDIANKLNITTATVHNDLVSAFDKMAIYISKRVNDGVLDVTEISEYFS